MNDDIPDSIGRLLRSVSAVSGRPRQPQLGPQPAQRLRAPERDAATVQPRQFVDDGQTEARARHALVGARPARQGPDLALVRLHGRNAATWDAKGLAASSDRFNYEYSDVELDELAGRIDKLVDRALDVVVLLNVNYEDQGVRAAQAIERRLQQAVQGLS